MADLTLALRHHRTRLVRSHTSPPLVVQRALYPDDALPDMAFIYLSNPTAGIFQGDHLKVAVRLCPGARCHITTQAATRIYAMPQGSARQETCLVVEEGACLEYLPEPLIPYRAARFSQATEAILAPGATLVYGEIVAPGRTAYGESLAYRCLQSRLTLRRPDGTPIYHEAFTLRPGSELALSLPKGQALTPGKASPPGLGVLGGDALTLGTLLVVSQGVEATLLRDGVKESLAKVTGARAGVTVLPYGSGVGVKVLVRDTALARLALGAAWSVARRLILGVDVPTLRS
jgi:urease accessory protein